MCLEDRVQDTVRVECRAAASTAEWWQKVKCERMIQPWVSVIGAAAKADVGGWPFL